MLTKTSCPQEIAVCDVIKERHGEKIFIVLKTGRNARWTHLIDIEHEKKGRAGRRANPFKIKTDDLLVRLSTNCEPEQQLELVPRLPMIAAERRRPAPFAKNRRSAAYREVARNPILSKGWKLVSWLLTFDATPREDGSRPEPSIFSDAFEEMLHRETRAKRIARFKKISGVCESTIRRVFRQFCQQGLTPAAASDNFDRSGGRGKIRNWKRKPGVKAAGNGPNGSACDDEIRYVLGMTADYYLTFTYRAGKRARKTFEDAILWAHVTFFAEEKVMAADGTITSLSLKKGRSITERQLQYYIQQNYSYEERRRHAIGTRRYLLHERPLTGHLCNSRGPGERYHIDATVLDFYLVGQILRFKVIGRPILYLVVDDFSRLIVGFYLSFEPASWDGAMMALINAVSPKVPFCASLGVYIEASEWPAARLCETLYADQGEMASIHKGTPLTTHFRVEVSNAPAYRPDWRSIMETRFKFVQKTLTPLLPGVVEKDSFERGTRHPAYNAALNIVEARKAVLRAILLHNRRPIRDYPTPPEMVEHELAASPVNLWHYGTDINGCGRRVDPDELAAFVMPSEKAVIDKQGILFGGNHYDCPTPSLIERQAMARAPGKGQQGKGKRRRDGQLEIRFDPSDNSRIQLLGLGAPISCPFSETNANQAVCGVTFKEQHMSNKQDRQNRRNDKESSKAKRAMEHSNLESDGAAAMRKTKDAVAQQGLKRLDISDLDEMREMERSVDSSSRRSGSARPNNGDGKPSSSASFEAARDTTDDTSGSSDETEVYADSACDESEHTFNSEAKKGFREAQEELARAALEAAIFA